MVAYLTDSQHLSDYAIERQKAWYLLSILVGLRRPARPDELAARCVLFEASADLVVFLCSIPESPIRLTEDLFVTVSSMAFAAVGKFVDSVRPYVPRIVLREGGRRGVWEGVIRTYNRKRKLNNQTSFVISFRRRRRLILPPMDEEGNQNKFALTEKLETPAEADRISTIYHDSRVLRLDTSIFPLAHHTNVVSPSNLSGNDGYVEDSDIGVSEMIVSKRLPKSVGRQHLRSLKRNKDSSLKKDITLKTGLELTLPLITTENSIVQLEILMGETKCINEMDLISTYMEAEPQPDAFPVENGPADTAWRVLDGRMVQSEADFGCKEGENATNSGIAVDGRGDLVLTDTKVHTQLKDDLGSRNVITYENPTIPLISENIKVEMQGFCPSAKPYAAKMQPTNPSFKGMDRQQDALLEPKVTSNLLDHCAAVAPNQQEQYKKVQKGISMKERLKKNLKMAAKENRLNLTSADSKKHLEADALPEFESYIVEEAEGSGGYGTVYRARRKEDGKIFAIKCPHPKAHKHHVHNELKMLEQFGGQNFVIRLEGSFIKGNSECFVLEHVEHDRPEVLKREIDVFQLKWYGYCLFRALASLHKQGVVHRDVKPGNFLFSRKLNKGYLIDFNLAVDLNRKYGITSKSKTHSWSSNHAPLQSAEYSSPIKGRKVFGNIVMESGCQETAKDPKLLVEPKNMKNRADLDRLKSYPDLGGRSVFKGQGADGPGMASTKDVTSTRTPSAERLREPLPYSSRKELNRLVREAMGNPDQKAVRVSASQRKRIAAPHGKVDKKLCLTPMPLNSGGATVYGAGLLKNKGDGKQKKEGPCVGTKGFRAPEVLFRSRYQGFKVDVWSAGVTLLYLIIGKNPFTGDPEQNIKAISKLKGSEDLWEVAKLHNRESSFPEELFDVQSLAPMSLRDWCVMNTKRPEFLDVIPNSLFDLVEKCLTVNPRLRIGVDEALRHEFFARCTEDVKKMKLMRKGIFPDSGSSPLYIEDGTEAVNAQSMNQVL